MHLVINKMKMLPKMAKLYPLHIIRGVTISILGDIIKANVSFISLMGLLAVLSASFSSAKDSRILFSNESGGFGFFRAKKIVEPIIAITVKIRKKVDCLYLFFSTIAAMPLPKIYELMNQAQK